MKQAQKARTEDESVFDGFASKGTASSGSGLPARGDCEAVRSIECHDQTLCETATRDGNGRTQSHSGATAEEIGAPASPAGGAAASI